MFSAGYSNAPHCVKKGTNTSAHALEHLLIGVVPHALFLQQSWDTAGTSVVANAWHSRRLVTGAGLGVGELPVVEQAAAAVRNVSEKSALRPRSLGSHTLVRGASSEPHGLAQNPRSVPTPAHVAAAANSSSCGQVDEPAPVVLSQVLAKASSWSCNASPKLS